MAVGDLTPKTYQVVLGIADTDVIPAIAANKKFHVTGIIAGNVNAATKHFTIYRVPSGQAVGDGYVIGGKLKKLVGTGDTGGGGEWASSIPFQLDTGDKISGIAETVDCITVIVSGLEEALA